MSVDIEEELSFVQPEDSSTESSKKPIRSYTREFLLSLSGLEICKKLPEGFDESLLSGLEIFKKLPEGFDESLLSEFEDTYFGPPDRSRVPGSSPLQGFRRSEYGSSPPTRGNSGNYSRGGLSRWDSRSSGRSDGDSDSDSGRRYVSQARRSWQNPEHDGLLGSGSFPRPPGYTGGGAAPRFRPSENTHLNKSNEPYHPPRPYKAVPYSRRETTDSLNDETFGSIDDSTNEDRVEEEKKRRVEFELMREQQHKALQEKQKLNSSKPKDPLSDMTGLLENPSDSKISGDSDKVLKQAPLDDAVKLSVSSQAPPSRPLVPPGFMSSALDKSFATKSLVHADSSQVGHPELEGDNIDIKSVVQDRGGGNLYREMSSLTNVMGKKESNSLSALQGVDQAKTSSFPVVDEFLPNCEVLGLDSNDITGHKLLGEPAGSTSILDKLFGNTSTPSSISTSTFVEGHHLKADDIWSVDPLQSKFARWFVEEDKEHVGEVSSEKSNNLFSMIVGAQKSGIDGPEVVATGPSLPPEIMLGQKTSISAPSTTRMAEQFANSKVPEPATSVLTCEDLEQSMLSEIGGDISNSLPPEKHQNAFEVKNRNSGPAVDNLASQHLLSLLQRGLSSNDRISIPGLEETFLDKPGDHEVGKLGLPDGNTNTADNKGYNSSDKTLTLESLFGTAFMKELHSGQRNPMDSARMEVSDGMLFPTKMNESGIGVDSHNGSSLASNDGITKFGGFDGGNGARLPEEDSLANLLDPINDESSILVPNPNSFDPDLLSSSSNVPFNVIEKLAVLGGAVKDERSMVNGQDPALIRGPYDMLKPELPYQNLHPQASSPQVHAAPMNHGRPLFHPLELHPVHLDPNLKFMSPEAVIHRNAPTHHQFSTNMGHPSFPHPSAGLSGFDHPIPPPVVQQMQMAGKIPPPHLVRGFSGAAPMLPHPSHAPAGFIQDHPMQGFPFGQRQPNFGGPGMTLPGPELGAANSSPEAFQRLLEMELRANPKQMHPFGGGGTSRAMYGPELDTGFRYR